jgi:hypothetical protein
MQCCCAPSWYHYPCCLVPHLGITILIASFAELYSFPSCICVFNAALVQLTNY